MRALTLLAFFIPASVFADTRLDRWSGGAKHVDVEGKVEVPLLSGPYGDPTPHIHVRFSDEEDARSYIFRIDTGVDGIVLAPSVAKELGLKVSTKNKNCWKSLGRKADKAVWRPGGKNQVTRADALYIGDGLTLRKVTLKVAPVSSSALAEDVDKELVAGVLGPVGLDLAVAIQPSTGKVTFASAEDGVDLINMVGGEKVRFSSVKSSFVRTPSGQAPRPAVPVIMAPLQVGDATVRLSLDTGKWTSTLYTHVGAGGAPTMQNGDLDLHRYSASIGSMPLRDSWFVRMGTAGAWTWPTTWMGEITATDGSLGFHSIRTFDVAVDPGSKMVAMAPAADQVRTWSLPLEHAVAEKGLAELDKPGEEGEDEGDADEKAKKKASLLRDHGWFQLGRGDLAGAVETLEEAMALDADPCQAWELMGKSYLAAQRMPEAVDAFQKATERYASWASLSKDDRDKYSKMDEDELEALGVVPQDLDACDASSGWLALAQVATGDDAAAIDTYREHADLHPFLPHMAAIAHIKQGEPAMAEGPARQAVNLLPRWNQSAIINEPATRLALAEALRASGDHEKARSQWERAADTLQWDYLSLHYYHDLLAALEGKDAALDALQDMAAERPDSPALKTVVGNLLLEAGQASAGLEMLEGARTLLDEQLQLFPNVTGVQALMAWHLLQVNELDEAREHAEQELKAGPAPYAFAVLSELHRRVGEMDEARKNWELARAYGSPQVTFALLREPVPPPPPPAPVEESEEEAE